MKRHLWLWLSLMLCVIKNPMGILISRPLVLSGEMRFLFICNQGENRSRTAKELFDGMGQDARYAALYNDKHALSDRLLQWADLIVVFEEGQLDELKRRFPEAAIHKRLVNLGIDDIYPYGNPELQALILKKMDDLA